MERKTLEQTVFEMLTENTGRALCDSGGAYGRNWERNQTKSIDDFKNQPAAWLECSKWNDRYEIIPTISIFHKLAGDHSPLELDDLCHEFNAMPVNDWDSDSFYGVSAAGESWLTANGFQSDGEAFNTYNWDNNFSQILQGHILTGPDDEYYALLQIHGGCDARGGYTDARLFKVNTGWHEYYAVYDDRCGFSVESDSSLAADNHGCLSVDWSGEWISHGGSSADDEYIAEFCKAAGVNDDSGDIVIHGDIWE